MCTCACAHVHVHDIETVLSCLIHHSLKASISKFNFTVNKLKLFGQNIQCANGQVKIMPDELKLIDMMPPNKASLVLPTTFSSFYSTLPTLLSPCMSLSASCRPLPVTVCHLTKASML